MFFVSSNGTNQYKDINLINNFDCGRMLQQSYFGSVDGSVWPFPTGPRSWRWNPVQGGSYLNQPGSVLSWTNATENCFVSYTNPRHWVTGEIMKDVEMKQTACLQDDILHIRFRMKYTGQTTHDLADQEMPAVFLWRGISRLVAYTGADPWSKKELQQIDPIISPTVKTDYINATENWAAYVNKDTGWGFGMYFPHGTKLAYYIVDSPQNGPEECAYFAPIKQMAISPKATIEYDVYITLGTIDVIRNRFYAIRQS